ncbi:MAG: TAXI family TRAP transporter solute-binding subunit [Bilophila sp.]
MRTLFSAALVALALTVLPPSALAEKQKLTAVSGPVSGGWYLGVGLVAKAFTDANPEYEVTMLPGNSTSNVIQLQQRKADLSIGMRTMNMAAIEGRSPYKKAFPNIAAYANLNDTALFHFVATKKSGITSIAQIRDQKMPIRLAYGAVGGSGEVFCGWVFEGYGFGYKDIRSWGGKLYSNNFDDIVNMAKDGQLDVIVWVGPGESSFSPNSCRTSIWSGSPWRGRSSMPFPRSTALARAPSPAPCSRGMWAVISPPFPRSTS